MSPFSAATKKEGEEVLRSRDLDWVILRPSVVVGRSAYGGSPLLRGAAARHFLADDDIARHIALMKA